MAWSNVSQGWTVPVMELLIIDETPLTSGQPDDVVETVYES